ncbi:MAG: TetR family transcriptional regulator C-terminal domain-containing protein, partial [Cyanobacteria bacterium]|nr:TetR family transcriptional regulator C-terminal domain-containing protein [Cyanobacteriota bacterium]
KFSESSQIMNDKSLTPLNRLRMCLVSGMKRFVEANYQSGCLFGALAHELASQSESIKEALDQMYHRWMEEYLVCFKEAQECGEFPPHLDLNILVENYGMALQGAIAEAKVVRSLKSFQVVHWLYFTQIGKPQSSLDPESEALLKLPVVNTPQ